MTDEQSAAEPTASDATTASPEAADVRLMIHRHYIKDLSVENPNAPTIFTTREQPKVQVQLDVRANRVVERVFEVILAIKVEAKIEENTAFLIELDFAALSKVGDKVAEEEVEGILAIEVPQLLFPFARNIVADVTRDGGFPPLLINPVDFRVLHGRKAESQAGGGDGADAKDEAGPTAEDEPAGTA